MLKALVAYLAQRPDGAAFLLPGELQRTLVELFPSAELLLPRPYKIFPADETQAPSLGFPVSETAVLRELEAKLERWIVEETASQVTRTPQARERAVAAFQAYCGPLMKVAENAMMSNLLTDYHAVFWLAHSNDLARHFGGITRRVNALDTQMARTSGDAIKYRIFSRWMTETREQMTQVAARAASLLEGEEQRSLQFFRLLQDDVLILTEEFIGPDLRELKSFVNGYLRLEFQSFRDSFERLRTTASDLATRDRTFACALPHFGGNGAVTLALLLDARFQTFLFDHPAIQNVVSREEREQFQIITRRLREFAVLSLLRKGIVWMTTLADGSVMSADRRSGGASYSRSTRPMDFGRPGVVDPMVHRFGLIYDISAFSETLGTIRRGGGKEEMRSYRQMLMFQRKLDTITARHLLQFEKFLGDGAFYTTRRAIRLVRAALEIQRAYGELRRKGFAFNKGLRIAMNHGYYRLLPMKTSPESAEKITEFYGPGIVELSRLTTGKSSKEIEEIASFLVAHGYEAMKVQQFFAPLQGADLIDHTQQAREFFAYIDSNGHLANEGIVASMEMTQELSNEIAQEGQQLLRISSSWGSYIGFAPLIPGVPHVGIKLLGRVALKGLDDTEVCEIVPFAEGEADLVEKVEGTEALITLLRQQYHQQHEDETPPPAIEVRTTEEEIASELVICVRAGSHDLADEVLIGVWDPRSDDVRRPLLIPRGDFQRLFALREDLSPEVLHSRRESVRDMYERLAMVSTYPDVPFGPYREAGEYDAWVLGEQIEKL
ncbi:MAG: hypothetical protein WA208_21010 [Thermoanaerobaculia bacterium]